jgi:hypothetical protein
LLGEQLAGQAASGVSLDSPSSSRARFRAREIAYTDIYRRAEEGNKKWANYKTQQNVFKSEAEAHKSAGQMNMLSSIIGAAGSVAGGISGQQSGGTAYQPTATKPVTPTFFSTGNPAEPASYGVGPGFRGPNPYRRYS